jgi:nucleoside phosphorylase
LGELKELASDTAVLADIKAACGLPKPDTEVHVHFGPLVSGAAVVASKDTFETLLDQHRNILGLEMEAYAAFVASESMGKPRPKTVVIKGVSDFADAKKDDRYQAYAAELSARFFVKSIERLCALPKF